MHELWPFERCTVSDDDEEQFLLLGKGSLPMAAFIGVVCRCDRSKRILMVSKMVFKVLSYGL